MATIIGCTTAAFVLIAPMPTEAATFKVKSGVTSIYHDLSFLSSIGLNLTGTNNTAKPVNSSFLVGFNIDPNSNFTFSDVNGFTPLSSTIQHTGTITFNNQVTVGNFSIDLAPKRTVQNASGLVLRDTVSLNTILFDLSIPGTIAFDGKDLTLADVKLLISPEFANILGNSSLAGVLGGTAQIDARVVSATVAEPLTLGGTALAGAMGWWMKRKLKVSQTA
jgi:hypothetical protein